MNGSQAPIQTDYVNYRKLIKPAIGGGLASMLAAIPVSIIKVFAWAYGLCLFLPSDFSDQLILFSTCGIFYNTWSESAGIGSFLTYMAIVLLGGVLCGVLVGRIVLQKAQARTAASTRAASPRLFWWGVVGGLLFSVFFVDIFLYPGQ